jgi:hypothetical protein
LGEGEIFMITRFAPLLATIIPGDPEKAESFECRD